MSYARVLDYCSLCKVADEVVRHLSPPTIAIDVIATHEDIEHLRSATSEVTTTHQTDASRIIAAFATLSAVPSVRVACLAVKFNSRKPPIILSHGIQLDVYKDLVGKALDTHSNTQVSLTSYLLLAGH